MPTRPDWEILNTTYLFTSPWYALRQDRLRLPDLTEITYTWIEHPGYALICPLLDDGRVVMERVYRHTLGSWSLECPSGGLDGQPPPVAAARELEEETGYLATHWTPLGVFGESTGVSNTRYHSFLARGLRAEGRLQREPAELMEVELIPFETLEAMAWSGDIQDSASTLSILLAGRRLRQEGK